MMNNGNMLDVRKLHVAYSGIQAVKA